MCCPIEPTNYINMVIQQSHSSPWREREGGTVTPTSDTVSTMPGARCYKPELGQFLSLQRMFSYISHKRAVITQCLLLLLSPIQYMKSCNCTKCC